MSSFHDIISLRIALLVLTAGLAVAADPGNDGGDKPAAPINLDIKAVPIAISDLPPSVAALANQTYPGISITTAAKGQDLIGTIYALLGSVNTKKYALEIRPGDGKAELVTQLKMNINGQVITATVTGVWPVSDPPQPASGK